MAIWNFKNAGTILFLESPTERILPKMAKICRLSKGLRNTFINANIGDTTRHTSNTLHSQVPSHHVQQKRLLELRPLNGKNGPLQIWELYYKQRKWISVNWSWNLSPSIQQNYHSKPWRDKHHHSINRADLAGIAAVLINEHTHIATDSATANKY